MTTRKKLIRGVDPMSLDLAKHMLSDIKDATDMDATELAERIQTCCEDFCAGLVDPDAE